MAKVTPKGSTGPLNKDPVNNEDMSNDPTEELVTIKKSELESIKGFMNTQWEENKKLRWLIEVAWNANKIRAEERKNFKPEKMKFSLSLFKENEETTKVITKWKMVNNEVDIDSNLRREIAKQKYRIYFSNEEKDSKIISLDDFRVKIIKTPKIEASKVYTPDGFEIRPTIDEKWRVYFKPPKVYTEEVNDITWRPLWSWRESFFIDIEYGAKKYQIENLYLN